MLHRFMIELVMDDNAELSEPPQPLSPEELEHLKARVAEQAQMGFGMQRGTRRRPLYPVIVETATIAYMGEAALRD